MPGLDAAMLPAGTPGQDLYRLDIVATIGFVVAAALAAAFPGPLRIPFAVVSCVLFVVGCLAFLWAYGKAIGRSREQQVSVAGIYGMSGTSPKPVQRRFHLLTTIQIVAAVATALMRPFTAQAFGILAPMLGLGLAGLWAAQHGTFADRTHGRHIDQDRARRSSTNG